MNYLKNIQYLIHENEDKKISKENKIIMSQYDYMNQQLCRKCVIKCCNLSKSDIKRMVMTEYEDRCDKCGRVSVLVDYIEEGE